MPIFKNQERITAIHKSNENISQIYYGTRLVWQKKFSFGTSSWSEIKKMIDDGSWIEQGWKIGDTHSLRLKDKTKMYVRIIGINDGREDSQDFSFQVDKQQDGQKVHLTLELTQCLPVKGFLFNTTEGEESQTYGDSLLYQRLQPEGDLYQNLPDDLIPLIIPVVKNGGVSGQNKDSEPQTSLNHLFVPSIREYVGNNSYEINLSEGQIYQFYSENPQNVQRSIVNQQENTYFWTRSASQIKDNVKNYFWSIGSSNNYSMYTSDTELALTYAFCI